MESLINGSNFEKGLLVTLVGMIGVFAVQVIFYLLIKLFVKVFPYKAESANEK